MNDKIMVKRDIVITGGKEEGPAGADGPLGRHER